jgi:hypothetical protein
MMMPCDNRITASLLFRLHCFGSWQTICVWLVSGLVANIATGAERDPQPPPQAIDSGQQLAIEQIEQLVATGEYAEALDSVSELFDEGRGALVPVGPDQSAGTQRMQKYIALRDWCQATTARLLEADPDLEQRYRQRTRGLAQAAYESARSSKEIADAARAFQRYRAGEYGDRLGLLLADLYLERGATVASMETLRKFDSRIWVAIEEEQQEPTTNDWSYTSSQIGWWLLWSQCDDSAMRKEALKLWHQRYQQLTSQSRSQPDRASIDDLLQRLLAAATLDPDVMGRQEIIAWLSAIAEQRNEPVEDKQTLESLRKQLVGVERWSTTPSSRSWKTFAASQRRGGYVLGLRNEQRFDAGQWPNWQQQLESYVAYAQTDGDVPPRVGETRRSTLAYSPVIVGGRAYVNELTKITAYDLESGKPWPDIAPPLPLFDSRIAPAAFMPLGYPLVGAPRGTLHVHGQHLYARMGSPVTGWANRGSPADGGSASYLVGLDLNRQGSLLAGFPLRLREPGFTRAEFEGCPIVFGDLLIAPVIQRDNVGISRSVAAFDRFSGSLRWKSEPLATGSVPGTDRANMISHQLLTLAGGRLFYNTNLGQIACLDPLTGDAEWSVAYQTRYSLDANEHPVERFRYRQLNPCAVANGLVYCMPQDAPELFALDATTGDLVWATNDQATRDAADVLGVAGKTLLVGGDRLVWLNAHTGRVVGRFPAATTPGPVHALPSPRGLGRGLVQGDRVYWPIKDEVLVFAADLVTSPPENVDAPPMRQRYQIARGGHEGVNLIAAEGWLLMVTPGRMMAFQQVVPD